MGLGVLLLCLKIHERQSRGSWVCREPPPDSKFVVEMREFKDFLKLIILDGLLPTQILSRVGRHGVNLSMG